MNMPLGAVSASSDWKWVLALIGVLAIAVIFSLFCFYKGIQKSTFIEKLLRLPEDRRRPFVEKLLRLPEDQKRQSDRIAEKSPPQRVIVFAEEFLARRIEFWLLYAQFIVATFFVGAIAVLMLHGTISVDAGLPALSTVVGIVLGKTLLSAKGAPLSAQEKTVDESGAPVNTEPPTIVDAGNTPKVGDELTANRGRWAGLLPMNYEYEWRRSSDKEEMAIPDAHTSSYTLKDEDKGSLISVAVTARNIVGSVTAFSYEVGPIV
jgi:hypothetical protein